jgi:putative ABC transport system substrate-binding protein
VKRTSLPLRRRGFITLLGGATAAPWIARAQTIPKVLRIGIVSTILPRTAYYWVAFDRRMRELGYIEGQSLTVDFINLNGQIDRYAEAMKELVGRNVQVILAPGNEIAVKSAQEASRTLPIVMVAIDYDPLARGYVQSLARPGGTLQGWSRSRSN